MKLIKIKTKRLLTHHWWSSSFKYSCHKWRFKGPSRIKQYMPYYQSPTVPKFDTLKLTNLKSKAVEIVKAKVLWEKLAKTYGFNK